MSTSKYGAWIGAGLLVLGSASALAQSSVPSTGSSPAMSKSAETADKSFVDAAAVGGITEVKLGQLAQNSGSAAEVKSFGQHMVDDHTKANNELAALAKTKGITPPSTPDADHQKVIEKFSVLNGKDFDSAYWKQMLDDHKKTITLFEKEAQFGKDSDLKAFASKTLPTLKGHLQMVQETMKGKL